ncbi:trypsin CFT-1-like [Pieris rapae]|uniref:trypsin CFT-1-like n=1 Tax=Pieris rapae TaxID=64459 RepID=UPI001E27D000|nr:trypsin CFT-1-like [Pieris rapae]
MLPIQILALCLTIASAASAPQQRIAGGSVAVITSYPFATALLRSKDYVTYSQVCAGSIINTKSVLTAASCFFGDSTSLWRMRVGSSWANSGGSVHVVTRVILNPYYNPRIQDGDIAIIQSSSNFIYSNSVRPASIAGVNYVLTDNQAVWAIGWGFTYNGGPPSEQLRQVQIWTVNQTVCKNRYRSLGQSVTDNMLCSGWLDVGSRDQCQYDAGGPLIHNNAVVGICSWGYQCGTPTYPGVNTRVSRYTPWIQANA